MERRLGWVQFALLNEAEAYAWLQRLDRLDLETVTSCFRDVSDDIVTDITRDFCIELVMVNSTRIRQSWNERKVSP